VGRLSLRRKRKSRGSRRARRNQGSTARRVGILAGAIVLVAGMSYAVSRAAVWGRRSEEFLLARVDIRGNVVLTPEEVLEAADLDMGSALLSVGIAGIESTLEAHPRIERAQVTRSLPDRVVIGIGEKLPIALLGTTSGDFVELAGDGTALPTVERSGLVDLPIISGVGGEPTAGQAFDSPEVRVALSVMQEAERIAPGITSEFSEVRIAPGSGLVLYTVADGAEVRFGSGAQNTRDLARLAAVLSHLRGHDEAARGIDMRYRDQVVVRLGGARASERPRREGAS